MCTNMRCSRVVVLVVVAVVVWRSVVHGIRIKLVSVWVEVHHALVCVLKCYNYTIFDLIRTLKRVIGGNAGKCISSKVVARSN